MCFYFSLVFPCGISTWVEVWWRIKERTKYTSMFFFQKSYFCTFSFALNLYHVCWVHLFIFITLQLPVDLISFSFFKEKKFYAFFIAKKTYPLKVFLLSLLNKTNNAFVTNIVQLKSWRVFFGRSGVFVVFNFLLVLKYCVEFL
jgi:hypothetical protein